MTTKSLPKIPIPVAAYDALAAVVELGAECIAKLAALVAEKRGVVQLPNLTGVVHDWAKELGVTDEALAKAIMGAIIPANNLRLDSGLTQEAFIEAFTRSVEQGAKKAGGKWKKEYAEAWPQIAAALTPMFAPDNFFSTAIKTAQLLGNQPAVFLDVKMLTELRPIYNEAAEKIQTLLMTNTLVLTYSQDDHPRTIHVTMDSDDLRKMAEVLDRAKRKNTAAEGQSQDWGINVLPVTNHVS